MCGSHDGVKHGWRQHNSPVNRGGGGGGGGSDLSKQKQQPELSFSETELQVKSNFPNPKLNHADLLSSPLTPHSS